MSFFSSAEVGRRKPWKPEAKGSSQRTLTPQQKEKKLQEIKKKMDEALGGIQRRFNEPLREQRERSQRGEHVFNNNLLNLHSKLLKIL
ncbi:MAG: hypothetical protein ACRC31_06435 [Cetobacterium sp.]